MVLEMKKIRIQIRIFQVEEINTRRKRRCEIF